MLWLSGCVKFLGPSRARLPRCVNTEIEGKSRKSRITRIRSPAGNATNQITNLYYMWITKQNINGMFFPSARHVWLLRSSRSALSYHSIPALFSDLLLFHQIIHSCSKITARFLSEPMALPQHRGFPWSLVHFICFGSILVS